MLDLSHVEISNGVIDMSMKEKAGYIRELSKDFIVLTEVGSKDSEKIIPPFREVSSAPSEARSSLSAFVRESGVTAASQQLAQALLPLPHLLHVAPEQSIRIRSEIYQIRRRKAPKKIIL